jgi:hypothetical protein
LEGRGLDERDPDNSDGPAGIQWCSLISFVVMLLCLGFQKGAVVGA